MQKPILAIGLLMFIVVWASSGGRNPFFEREAIKPTPCRAALIRLEKQVPSSWKLLCEGNNLAVEIVEASSELDVKKLKTLLYRQMANHLVLLAKSSQADILEKVFIVRLRLSHSKLEINAVSEGKYVAKLATLTSPEFIMEHLQQTVQVKETLK